MNSCQVYVSFEVFNHPHFPMPFLCALINLYLFIPLKTKRFVKLNFFFFRFLLIAFLCCMIAFVPSSAQYYYGGVSVFFILVNKLCSFLLSTLLDFSIIHTTVTAIHTMVATDIMDILMAFMVIIGNEVLTKLQHYNHRNRNGPKQVENIIFTFSLLIVI